MAAALKNVEIVASFASKVSVAHPNWALEFPRAQVPKQLELWPTDRSEFADKLRDADQPLSRFGRELTTAPFRELEITIDIKEGVIWCFMRPTGPPSFTPTLLSELISMRRILQRLFARLRPGESSPIKYFVGGSRLPGIFNLGGDLAFFIEKIRSRDLKALRAYAHSCVDVAYHMTVGFYLPLMTIGVVQGDALGGGLEGALSFNVLVAEKSAKFGLPEILFNLFPGMGAFSYLSRKVNMVRAQKMILSGRVYSAADLYDMGLVDVLAEDGRGEEAVRDYIRHNRHRHVVHQRVRDITTRLDPVSLEELRDVADIWAEHAIKLDDFDLRIMERLLKAQHRRLVTPRSHNGRSFPSLRRDIAP